MFLFLILRYIMLPFKSMFDNGTSTNEIFSLLISSKLHSSQYQATQKGGGMSIHFKHKGWTLQRHITFKFLPWVIKKLKTTTTLIQYNYFTKKNIELLDSLFSSILNSRKKSLHETNFQTFP
jgi:hypothetical protein